MARLERQPRRRPRQRRDQDAAPRGTPLLRVLLILHAAPVSGCLLHRRPVGGVHRLGPAIVLHRQQRHKDWLRRLELLLEPGKPRLGCGLLVRRLLDAGGLPREPCLLRCLQARRLTAVAFSPVLWQRLGAARRTTQPNAAQSRRELTLHWVHRPWAGGNRAGSSFFGIFRQILNCPKGVRNAVHRFSLLTVRSYTSPYTLDAAGKGGGGAQNLRSLISYMPTKVMPCLPDGGASLQVDRGRRMAVCGLSRAELPFYEAITLPLHRPLPHAKMSHIWPREGQPLTLDELRWAKVRGLGGAEGGVVRPHPLTAPIVTPACTPSCTHLRPAVAPLQPQSNSR